MSGLLITKGELYEIIKKRKISSIDEGVETDQEDGKKIEENINELIIENEAEKFIELFEKTFSEETEEFDSEDGLVQDLFTGIVLKIKEKLLKSARKNTAQVLKLMFNFIEEIVRKNNGEDKSNSASETCKH